MFYEKTIRRMFSFAALVFVAIVVFEVLYKNKMHDYSEYWFGPVLPVLFNVLIVTSAAVIWYSLFAYLASKVWMTVAKSYALDRAEDAFFFVRLFISVECRNRWNNYVSKRSETTILECDNGAK